MASVAETAELVCELCRQFYTLGWVSGTGGGISIRADEGIVMAPSGVQKERIRAAALQVELQLSSLDFCQVEQVIDEARFQPDVSANHVEPFLEFWRQVLFFRGGAGPHEDWI